MPLSGYFLNTIIFTVITTALMLVVTILAAFGFSRLRFRGRDLAFTIFLSLMMIPNELVVITNFVTITNLDLRNTFTGLILPSVTSVFHIYLLKENFSQIPDELYYAAKADGASDLRCNQEYKMSVRDTQEIPLQWGGKLVVHNCIVVGDIDARFMPAIV